MEPYKTVRTKGSCLLEQKKSLFYGTCARVEDTNQVEVFLLECKKKHQDASHHAYAYRLHDPVLKEKAYDDNEPGRTAGAPILHVIDRHSLDFVCIVVSRVFGGVLLGAPGLVRAYGKAAAMAVEQAKPVWMISHLPLDIRTNYVHYGKIEYYIENHKIKKSKTVFGADVRFTLYVAKDQSEKVIKALLDITAGDICVKKNKEIAMEGRPSTER